MQSFKFFVLTFALATACGGQVDTAATRRGNTNGGEPASGGMSGSSGNSNGGSQSGGGAPAGGATQGCQSPTDCPVLDCMHCPDGSVVCPSAECLGGQCINVAPPVCPPPVAGSCNPNFCAGVAGAIGCCMTPNGPCGVDYGNGCVDTTACQYGGCGMPGTCVTTRDCALMGGPTCHPCPDDSCIPINWVCVRGRCEDATACPAQPVYRWFKSCGTPTHCEGSATCDPTAGQSVGAPCFVQDQMCMQACPEFLICADRDPCTLI